MRSLPSILLLAALGCGKSGSPPAQAVPTSFSVRGELLRDEVQTIPGWGDLYRIYLETSNGIVTYPILASPEEINQMMRTYRSREEAGKGDMLAVNPLTNMISIDLEGILTPEKIRKIH